MTLDIACPACRTVLRLPDFLAGTTATCAGCGAAVQVPPSAFQAAQTVAATVATPGSFRQESFRGDSHPTSVAESDPPPGTPLHAEVHAARADPRKRLGRFVLLAELGVGGMGVVHRAWDGRLRRVVALKMLLPGGETNAGVVKRFYREAEAVARLRHENIVSVFEAGEMEKRPFIAMEFVQGASLAQYLERSPGQRLPARAAAELVRDVARALHHAHEQGVIHRDLKPGNIMIDASGKPRVLDFGLARLSGDRSKLTKSGTTLGTPAYMPPEQTGGDEGKIDKRSDVYSLGATLFHALSGRPPFVGTTEFEIVTAVLTKDPPPPSQFEKSALGDLDTICLRCLEKEPADRYATAGELAGELDRWLAGAEIRTQPVSAASLIARRIQRNRGLAYGLAGGACVLGLVLGVVGKLVGDKRALEAQLAHKSPDPSATDKPTIEPSVVPVVVASPVPTPSAPAVVASPSPTPSSAPTPEPTPAPEPTPSRAPAPEPTPSANAPAPTVVVAPTPSPDAAPAKPAPPPRPVPDGKKATNGWALKLKNDPRRMPQAIDAVASDGKLVYGFGGLAQASNGLWALDPEHPDGWHLLHKGDGVAPEPRMQSALVWAGARLLLFGGADLRGETPRAFSDLWAFDVHSKRWAQVVGSGEPSPRFGHAACWTLSELVVFGGSSLAGKRTTALNELWIWDERDGWSDKRPELVLENSKKKKGSREAPPARSGACLVWEFATESSTDHDGRGHTFGGFGTGNGEDARTFSLKVHPGKKNVKSWHMSEKEPLADAASPDGPTPPPRKDAAGCYDSEAKRILFFGGTTAAGKSLGDLWALKLGKEDGAEGRWARLSGASDGPGARASNLAWVDKRAVLVGGVRPAEGNWAEDVLNDVWIWTPPR